LQAFDRCSTIGNGFSSGIVALDADEVQSIAMRIRPESWQGNDLQYAQKVAKDNFGMTFAYEGPEQVWRHEWFTRTVNLNHFGPNVPAAAYYEQSDCNWWDMHEDNQQCSTITEGRYFPNLVIPEKLKSLNPDWKDCKVAFGVQDPPIALSVVDRIAVPTLPFNSDPEKTSSGAREAGYVALTPTATPYPSALEQWGLAPTRITTSIVLGSSTLAAIYDLGTVAQQTGLPQPEARGRLSGPQARIIIGSQTISMNGPAKTIADQIISLNSDGIIIEGRRPDRSRGSKTTIAPQMVQPEAGLGGSRAGGMATGRGGTADVLSGTADVPGGTADGPGVSTWKKSAASNSRLQRSYIDLIGLGLACVYFTV
jgi:hypothetical protein